MQAATANGIDIPGFCWHPALSIAGNCRVCAVQIEGRSWVEIACNMPVSEGLRVLTDSEPVRAYRKELLQLVTLNHPVDCGICDKSGECTLQDYHYKYNGSPSVSRDAKVRSTKFHPLSERIVLDNERCILCSRCVRFTREISKTNALGIVQRGDTSLVRASEDGAFDDDPYSDNVIDICPVGALLSKPFLYKARVWYLRADAFGVPRLRARLHGPDLAPQGRVEIARARPAAERQHRARHAARESRRQWTLDLQQGTRPGAHLRASARRAGTGEGPAGRLAGGDRGCGKADPRGPARGGDGVQLGLQRGARGVLRNARRPLRELREGGLLARAGRMRRGRPADPAGQESEHRGGPRVVRPQ